MATSTIKSKKGYVNTSFANMGQSFIFTALNNIDSNISSLNSGVGNVITGDGPIYSYVLAKYSNVYYSGILIGYGLQNPMFFRRSNTQYFANEMI